MLNIRTSKYMKQKSTELKEAKGNSTTTGGD